MNSPICGTCIYFNSPNKCLKFFEKYIWAFEKGCDNWKAITVSYDTTTTTATALQSYLTVNNLNKNI